MNCNNNIKKFRKKLNLTQSQLSMKINISCSYLSHLENGSRLNPSYTVMQNLANALNCKISDIFE